MRPSFFHHLHPPTIPERQSRLGYTLGAGGFSVFLLLVVILTGALELFYYIPTPEQAAQSIQTISFFVPFGGFVRNLHYWSAQLLVISVVVHMLRVLLTGGYAAPRRFNYLIGLLLLVLVLLLDFTGYMLRWDEGIRWALVAGTNLVRSIPLLGEGLERCVVGGPQVGGATLIRFYAWHIFGLTLVLVFFGVWHLFKVRRDGGIAAPPPLDRQSRARITRNELVRREILAALFAGVVLIILALLFPAPIAPAMEAAPSGAGDARAPWFFLWVQNLLRLGDPFLLGVLVPLLVLALLAVLPYIFRNVKSEHLGRWLPPSGRAVQIIVGVVALIILFLSIQALYLY